MFGESVENMEVIFIILQEFQHILAKDKGEHS